MRTNTFKTQGELIPIDYEEAFFDSILKKEMGSRLLFECSTNDLVGIATYEVIFQQLEPNSDVSVKTG